MNKPKLLFVYDLGSHEDMWRDGLWSALKILEQDFEVSKHNLSEDNQFPSPYEQDFILGWGAFGGTVDRALQHVELSNYKKGLCIGGNVHPPTGADNYDVLFYETEWYKPQIASHKNIIHAFGVNTDIFGQAPKVSSQKIWDYLTVGCFSLWKRQTLLGNKKGDKLAVGDIQQNNQRESYAIIYDLLQDGVAISGQVHPERLVKIYRASKNVYIPADINGGGERAVLEARVCGIPVEIEKDNPKLAELLTCPIYDQNYYANQLKKGIFSVL